jgi:two-component system, OmpR family, sensor histidine kinase SenX3
VTAAASAALLGGVLLGMVACRWSARRHSRPAEGVSADTPELPPGATDILAMLPSFAVVLNSEDRVMMASPGAQAFGIVRDGKLAGQEILAVVRSVRRTGRIQEADLDLPRGRLGHAKVAVSARVAPLPPNLVVVLLTDHTETRRLDAVRRDFVANVSHELKTPVGALALLAEAVEEASGDSEAVTRFAGRMRHEAARLTALIQELISLSRVQGAESPPTATAVGIAEFTDEALDRCRLAAAAKDISLTCGEPPDLAIRGDREQLVTALRNLIDNAISYSPEQTKVAISTRVLDEVVEVSVTDQGIGIAEGDRDRIFERFYRVDQARSRETGGTGLGLSIVKHIVANHGGEVRVWSAPGSGSTFTLRLPVTGPFGLLGDHGSVVLPGLTASLPGGEDE